MTTEAVQYSKEQSTDIVYKKKKRLAKSGKDTDAGCNGLYLILSRPLPLYVNRVTMWG